MSWYEGIYYEVDGAGEPLLLLPGWAGSIVELGSLRTSLASRFQVVAADLPGSGRSHPQPRSYTASYFQEDAAAFLGFIEAEFGGRAHLVGFSDGGEVALLMAALRPEAAFSVATWGAAGQLVAPPGMLDAFARLVDDPIPPLREFSAYLTREYGVENARAMTRSEAAALGAIIEAGGDISRSRAQDIGCRVLLVTGELDPFCPPALVSALAAEIPNAEFVRADGAGHDVHHSRPEWLVETMLGWFAQPAVTS